MIISLVILGALAASYYFYITVREKQRYFEKLGLPYEKPVFLIGNCWKTLIGKENMTVFLKNVYDRHPGKRVIGLFQGVAPSLMLRDPELIAAATVKDFSSFHDRGMPINEDVNPLEGHLFNIEGLRWRILRNKLSPTFTSGKLRGMLPLMEKCADSFIEDVENTSGKEINVKNEFMTLAAHVIGSCTFGIDLHNNGNNDFINYGLKIIQPDVKDLPKIMLRFFFPRLDKYVLKLKVIPQTIHEYFLGLVKDTMEHRKQTGETRNDFLQILLELKEKGEIVASEADKELSDGPLHPDQNESVALTDEVLTAQAVLFLVAGFETTSTTLSFLCYMLSKNQDKQDKLRREITMVKSKHGEFCFEAIREMHYLDAVINETLRLWPPISDAIRTCNKTTKLDNDVIVEKGVVISIPIRGIHHDPLYFSDPEFFRPERFMEDNIQNYTFMPFGSGPRNCIGERFARLEIKIIIAKLLERFKIDTCPKMAAAEPIAFRLDSFVCVPQEGPYCVFNRMKSSLDSC